MEPDQYTLMDAVEGEMWWYRALHVRAAAALGDVGDGRVLDAGCGTGGFLRRLGAARGYGVEFHPAAARRAAAKSGAAVAAGTVAALPFPDGAFQGVVSLDVLCHAAVDPPPALAELHRVLAPGGRLVVNLPAFEWLRSAHDTRVHNARRYTAAGVRTMLTGAGFADVRVAYWNTLLLPLMAAHRRLQSRAPDARSDVAAFSPWLDRFLHAVTVLERALHGAGLRAPVGGSVLAVASRPGSVGDACRPVR